MARVSSFDVRFIGISVVSMAGAMVWLFGCGGGGGKTSSSSASLYSKSVQNVVHLQLGLELYESDFDDVLPAANWMDGLIPYIHTDQYFHSPKASGQYGYAFNSGIAGIAATQIAQPDTTLTIFDSTVNVRNATAASTTLPSPPRYGSKNTEGFADGVTQDELDGATPATLYATSQTRLGSDALGLVLYANDNDDVLPLANEWVDGLVPYVKNVRDFHSPAIENMDPLDYGYAMNAALAGQGILSIASPSTTVSLFDSTDLTRNATDMLTTLPNPPRYGSNNTIAFADGHVQKSSKPARNR